MSEGSTWKRQTGIGGRLDGLGLTVAYRAILLTNLCGKRRRVGGRGFIYTTGILSLRNERGVMGWTGGDVLVAVSALAVRRGLQIVLWKRRSFTQIRVNIGTIQTVRLIITANNIFVSGCNIMTDNRCWNTATSTRPWGQNRTSFDKEEMKHWKDGNNWPHTLILHSWLTVSRESQSLN